jgi:hypothetical protein
LIQILSNFIQATEQQGFLLPWRHSLSFVSKAVQMRKTAPQGCGAVRMEQKGRKR